MLKQVSMRWDGPWHRRKNGEGQVRSAECVYGRLFSPEEEQWDEPERENAPKDRNKSSCVLVEIAPVRISTSVNIGKFDKSNLWKFLPRKKVLPWKGTDTDESTVQRPVPESTNFMEPNPGKIKIARFLRKIWWCLENMTFKFACTVPRCWTSKPCYCCCWTIQPPPLCWYICDECKSCLQCHQCEMKHFNSIPIVALCLSSSSSSSTSPINQSSSSTPSLSSTNHRLRASCEKQGKHHHGCHT